MYCENATPHSALFLSSFIVYLVINYPRIDAFVLNNEPLIMCGMQNPIQIEPSFALNEIVNVIYLHFIGKVFTYYIDQIEQITKGMLIVQKTKLINYRLMFLNKAFQPKAHNQGKP